MRKVAVLLFVLALVAGMGFYIYESSNAQKKLVDEENYRQVDLYFGEVGNPNFRAAENKVATIWLPKLWVESASTRFELPHTFSDFGSPIYNKNQLDTCYGVSDFIYEINTPEVAAQTGYYSMVRDYHIRKEEYTLDGVKLALYCTGTGNKEEAGLPEEERFYYYIYELEKEGYFIWVQFATKGLNSEDAIAFQKEIMSTLEFSESFKRTEK